MVAPLDAARLQEAIRARQGSIDRIVKFLLLGSSGVGKSFLGNIVVGSDVFAHRTQVAAVTGNTEGEYALLLHGREAWVVCNLPGWMEGSEKAMDQNARCIKTAFDFLQDPPLPRCVVDTAVLFVVGGLGAVSGRISKELLDFHKALFNCAVGDRPKAWAVVANAVDARQFAGEDEKRNYRGQLLSELEGLLASPVQLAIVDMVPLPRRTPWNKEVMTDAGTELLAMVAALANSGGHVTLSTSGLTRDLDILRGEEAKRKAKREEEERRAMKKAMTVAEAKAFWSSGNRVLQVDVDPCTCKWMPRSGDLKDFPCMLRQSTEALVISNVDALQIVSDSCTLLPNFRGDTCPKTGCDFGGHRGGWCANIIPDGTHCCGHLWWHGSKPCVVTEHTCIVSFVPVPKQD